MTEFWLGQTCYQLALSADELGGCSVTDLVVTEPTPGVQFPVMNGGGRWFRVMSGGVIIQTEQRSFTLNRGDDVFVPPGLRAYVRSALSHAPSRLQIVSGGWSWERMLAATASPVPGRPVPENLIETAKNWGLECEIIQHGEPVISKWLPGRPQTAAEAL